MNKGEIEEWVFDWIAGNTDVTREAAVSLKDANAFSEGILDSMKFIFFVTAAEECFGIHFTQDDFDFTQGRFVSISGLCDLIGEHLK